MGTVGKVGAFLLAALTVGFHSFLGQRRQRQRQQKEEGDRRVAVRTGSQYRIVIYDPCMLGWERKLRCDVGKPETVELKGHPWFVGVQYHPELKSRPLDPHPLFASFIAAAVEQSRLV